MWFGLEFTCKLQARYLLGKKLACVAAEAVFPYQKTVAGPRLGNLLPSRTGKLLPAP